MKKIFLLISLLVCALGMQAQVSPNDLLIVGYVNSSSNPPTAVPNWPVYYSPNDGVTFNQVLTDASGFYSFNITNGSQIGPNFDFIVYTLSCDLSTVYADTVSNNQGTVDSAFVNFSINCGASQNCEAPIYSFVSESAQFQFSTVDAPGLIAAYSWTINAVDQNGQSIGTGQTSTEPTIWYNTTPFITPAYLSVCLTLTYADGCVASFCDNFNYCNAGFTSNILSNNQISFTALSPNITTTNFNWSVNGVAYPNNGSSLNFQGQPNQDYLVCLDVLSNLGCLASSCGSISTPDTNSIGCDAGFDYIVFEDLPGFGITLQFTASNDDPLVLHSWTFSDGTNAEGGVVFKTFYNAGNINACHTIIDLNDSCSNTYCQVIALNDTSSSSCDALFTYQVVDNVVTLIPTGAVEGTVNALWYIGQSVTTEQFIPNVYLPNGVYDVCLYIWDGSGCQNYSCQTISINNDSTYSYCEAYYSYTSIGNTVNFENWSFSDGDPNTVNYSWDFGDNTVSLEANPIHTYAVEGWYVASLTINQGSCSNTYSNYIWIGNSNTDCSASFNNYSLSFTAPYVYQFASNTTGFSQDYNHYWSFSDGQVSYEANPIMVFPTSGTYSVCHYVQSTNPLTICSDSLCMTFEIYGVDSLGCSAFFTYSNDAAQPGYMTFAPYVADNSYTYQWQIGGQIFTELYPSYLFTTSGYNDVCLTIYGSNGCFDTYCTSIYNGGNSIGYTNIWGTVFAGANPADLGTAYLVSADSTSGSMQTLMEAPIVGGSYYFSNVPEGTYYIRAELTNGSFYYNNYVPTYFGSQYYWELAEPINLTAASVSPFGYTIALIYAGNNGGIGGIGGMVDEGPIRLMSPEASGLAEGPVSGANVVVTDLYGNPQRWTKSNSNGGFSIGNLDYGTYRLMADVAGIPCVPIEFTIAPGFENFDIMLVLGDGVTSVVNPIASEFITEVFPNPAKDLGSIRLNKLNAGEIQLDIINLAGQTIVSKKENVSAGLQNLELPVSGLANGSYLVNITDAAGNRIGVKRFSIAH